MTTIANWVNLTPHNINMPDGTVLKSSGLARCENRDGLPYEKGGMTIKSRSYGVTSGLPEPQESTFYVVSQIVASENGSRSDLFFPSDLKRDAGGNVIGIETLCQLPRHDRSLFDHYYAQAHTNDQKSAVANWQSFDFRPGSFVLQDGSWLDTKALEGGKTHLIVSAVGLGRFVDMTLNGPL